MGQKGSFVFAVVPNKGQLASFRFILLALGLHQPPLGRDMGTFYVLCPAEFADSLEDFFLGVATVKNKEVS